MVQPILIFKFLFLFFIIFFNFSVFSKTINGIAHVVDGDTIHIEKNKIRLHGIDAPEIDQTCTIKDKVWNCGIESSLELKKLILDNNISCVVSDIDKYNRYIAECFINNQNINELMVKNGWAIAYRYYSLDFIDDEEIAKNNKAGIWKGEFLDPYLFRKQQKN